MEGNIEIRNGVMNRIGWFTYLRIVFECSQHISTNTVFRTSFINELINSQYNLPLKSNEEYFRTSEDLGVSLMTIYTNINSMKTEIINFDQIIDMVINSDPVLKVIVIDYIE